MREWRRPYEVNWLRQLVPFAVVLVLMLLCFGGGRWLLLLNPLVDVVLLWVLILLWVGARAGVYVGDGGVAVRVGFRRIVVPWAEIASAEIAKMPSPTMPLPPPPTRTGPAQPGPSLGLTLVGPSGERRSLPVRLGGFTVYLGRGTPPVALTENQLKQVVNRINVVAAAQPPQPPPTAPPTDEWWVRPR